MNRLVGVVYLSVILLFSCTVEPDENVLDNTFVLMEGNPYARSESEMYKSIKNEFTQEEIERIVYVLKFYREKYRIKENKIMITQELSEDLDLITNYSKKAFDDGWRSNSGLK